MKKLFAQFALILAALLPLGAHGAACQTFAAGDTNYITKMNLLAAGCVPTGGVTTIVNLTGPITSVGNATSIASQTGTGTQFVMSGGTPVLANLTVTGASTLTGGASMTRANTTGIALLSGSAGAYTFHTIGRTGAEGQFAVAGATDQFLIGSAAGDILLNASGTNKLILGSQNVTALIANSSTVTLPGKISVGTTAAPVSKLNVVGTIGTGGTIPTLSGCGTSPAITTGSTATAGEVTQGTIATGCVITFNAAYPRAPFCVVTSEAGLAFSYVAAAATITITNIGALSSTKMNYICIQNDLL